jgi:hypothetical protein
MGMFDDARIIPLFAATLHHAIEGKFILRAICICGHEGSVDHAALAERHGRHTRLTWLEMRMRCTACRERGPSSVDLMRLFPDGRPYTCEVEERLARSQLIRTQHR